MIVQSSSEVRAVEVTSNKILVGFQRILCFEFQDLIRPNASPTPEATDNRKRLYLRENS